MNYSKNFINQKNCKSEVLLCSVMECEICHQVFRTNLGIPMFLYNLGCNSYVNKMCSIRCDFCLNVGVNALYYDKNQKNKCENQ